MKGVPLVMDVVEMDCQGKTNEGCYHWHIIWCSDARLLVLLYHILRHDMAILVLVNQSLSCFSWITTYYNHLQPKTIISQLFLSFKQCHCWCSLKGRASAPAPASVQRSVSCGGGHLSKLLLSDAAVFHRKFDWLIIIDNIVIEHICLIFVIFCDIHDINYIYIYIYQHNIKIWHGVWWHGII